MDMHSKDELTRAVASRYKQATKSQKGVILTEYCLNTGYKRKYAIKRLRQAYHHPSKEKNRGKRPNRAGSPYRLIKGILKVFWKASDYPSAVRLQALLPKLISKADQFNELGITKEEEELLRAISSASIGRMLRQEIRGHARKINSTTKPGSLITTIPLACDVEERKEAGYLEIDLVSHCGAAAVGEFIYTLNTTDFMTGWHESEAIMGKSQRAVTSGMEKISQRLPFPLHGIDSDNGSEFINANLKRFADVMKIEFTRSRPYKKNDNAHIEQKNWTNVRKIIGYFRLDSQEELALLNDLYRNELRLYLNFFMPSQKLISKERHGSKIKKKYDTPKTPFERVVARPEISDDIKKELQAIYDELNPFELKRQIDKKIDHIHTVITNTGKGAA